MSELTDRIIEDQIKRRPGARYAYDHDPAMHDGIERTRDMLTVMEAAMQREGIPYDAAERVLNEIVSAGLDGWERDKRSRERALLLAVMDPSEFGRLSSPVFTEPASRCISPGGGDHRRCELPAGHPGFHENNEVFGLKWANLPGDPADTGPAEDRQDET